MSKKSDVSALEFAQTWNAAESRKEVAEKLGMKYNAVVARERAYTAKGVHLKKMNNGKRGASIDVDAINAALGVETVAPEKKSRNRKGKVVEQVVDTATVAEQTPPQGDAVTAEVPTPTPEVTSETVLPPAGETSGN